MKSLCIKYIGAGFIYLNFSKVRSTLKWCLLVQLCSCSLLMRVCPKFKGSCLLLLIIMSELVNERMCIVIYYLVYNLCSSGL